MSLIYRCDNCDTQKRGDAIPGLTAQVSDCLPDCWGMRRGFLRNEIGILCPDCYTRKR